MFHPTMRGVEVSMLSPIIDKTAKRKSDNTRV
jgi:hypothetical protein